MYPPDLTTHPEYPDYKPSKDSLRLDLKSSQDDSYGSEYVSGSGRAYGQLTNDELNTPEINRLFTDSGGNLSVVTPTYIRQFNLQNFDTDERQPYEGCVTGQSNETPFPNDPLRTAQLYTCHTPKNYETEENDNVQCDNSMDASSFDTESKDLKLEMKRRRNRIAAARCRKKKIDMIRYYEGIVGSLKQEVNYLLEEKSNLDKVIDQMKIEIEYHLGRGCDMNYPCCYGADGTFVS